MRSFQALPRHAVLTTPLTAPARPFTSHFVDGLTEKVTRSVERLTKQVALFQDERMVTESRRKLERVHSAPETLAERVAAQRSVRQFIIPSDIKVDKSRQYIQFTWPREAIEAAVELEKAEATWQGKKEQQQQQCERSERQRQESVSPIRDREDISATSAATKATVTATATAKEKEGTTTATPEQQPWLRTRALAEYLRAYTPSTDGRYGTPHQPIYGRRGLTITDAYPIGNYALRITFSDGHTGGIYSYEYLFFLTSPASKYGLMRDYVKDLKAKRKSRDPPKRAPSRRRVPAKTTSAAGEVDTLGVGRRSENDDGGEGGHMAPAYPRR